MQSENTNSLKQLNMPNLRMTKAKSLFQATI